MAISTLQRAALERSPEFVTQVDGVVRTESLYKSELLDPQAPDTAQLRSVYAQVVRDPARYGFVPAIVADAGWSLTYDGWATAPDGATGAITAGVQKVFTLLTGAP